uniref:Uncharacterized protein n=1 Tax=Zea mays TaxID=4577 RepID=C4J712_MAIZE|nr:unknown [Zea mays]
MALVKKEKPICSIHVPCSARPAARAIRGAGSPGRCAASSVAPRQSAMGTRSRSKYRFSIPAAVEGRRCAKRSSSCAKAAARRRSRRGEGSGAASGAKGARE